MGKTYNYKTTTQFTSSRKYKHKYTSFTFFLLNFVVAFLSLVWRMSDNSKQGTIKNTHETAQKKRRLKIFNTAKFTNSFLECLLFFPSCICSKQLSTHSILILFYHHSPFPLCLLLIIQCTHFINVRRR